MVVLFFHHCCGIILTQCYFKCTILSPNPAEVKTGRLLSSGKAEQAHSVLFILTQACVWPANQNNWNSEHDMQSDSLKYCTANCLFYGQLGVLLPGTV